jgi:hypothetical protein
MALRDAIRDSAAPYPRPGEPVHRRFFADIYAADAALAAA